MYIKISFRTYFKRHFYIYFLRNYGRMRLFLQKQPGLIGRIGPQLYI